jgi:acetone carboxylase gamma subunit
MVARHNPIRHPLVVRVEAATTDCGSSSSGGGTANNKLSAWISVRHDDELLKVLPDLLAPRSGYLVVRMASGSNERKVIG